jgi:hypothetical protein
MNADSPPIAADKGMESGFVSSSGDDNRAKTLTHPSAFIAGCRRFPL